ncbi:hypothetical protein BDW42DRAFT_190360 [Aspergillus taichungensis]|uniref:Serine protease n=1 Tax=Aspergillus taichungensis TaxID=482145 RepID=A0A2J5I831_9EURO|nr:hypothetical protein BDW42DRAFT_190360 [Aspergillus taichungensis]
MSSALNHLTHALTCRAMAPANDGEGYHTITTSGPNLTQYLTTNDGESGLEESVAYDVRANTPAVYLVLNDVRMVFYLDAGNQLAFSSYEDDEWEEGEWHGLSQPVVVHPETQLSGLINEDQIWVLYQTPAGQLAAVVKHTGQWSLAGTIAADMAPRAPHMAMADGADPNHLHVFFFTNRHEICHTQGSLTTGDWRGSIVHGAHFDGPISRFLVIPTEDQRRFTVYAATVASKLMMISHEGPLTELGVIKGGRFVPPTRAESTFIINISFLSSGKWLFFGRETDERGGEKTMGDDLAAWMLPPELYHDDYIEGPRVNMDLGSKKVDPTRWYRFLVYLKMHKNDKSGNPGEYHGTGFFLSLPGARHEDKDVKVVLTAGHNLVGANGTMATAIQVASPDLGRSWLVGQEMAMVCPEYNTTIDKEGSPNDWGIVFISEFDTRDTKFKQLGFAFNLSLAVQPPFKVSSSVPGPELGGFRSSINGTPERVYSTLTGFHQFPQKISYKKGGTEPGMSGSPVWISCNNLLTVVGIHTTGSSMSKSRCQGVRLNLDILERIFAWTHTSQRGRLRAHEAPQFDREGLYLSFSRPGGIARVRLGSVGLETTFKVLPAGDIQVNLGPRGHKNPRGFLVATLPTDLEEKQRYLKMGSTYICEDDACYGPVESSEVSLVLHTTKNGNRFRLEPVEDDEKQT